MVQLVELVEFPEVAPTSISYAWALPKMQMARKIAASKVFVDLSICNNYKDYCHTLLFKSQQAIGKSDDAKWN